MELKHHPEVALYRQHRERAAAYRQAVTAWLQEDGTHAEVEVLLSSLISLLQTYNRILWHHFPYCSQCLGGCCVAGATDLKPVDYVALAVLEEQVPNRPERTGRDERACIYLTPQGCSWPARWRPLKCALFYCLGSGAISVDASDVRYGEITAALEAAIAPRLARLLPNHAESLLALLPDPVAFADALSAALDKTILGLLYERNPHLRPQAPPAEEAGPVATTLEFIAAASQKLWTDPSPPPPGSEVTAEQFLDDLETLAWIVEGRPANATDLLSNMGRRYPRPQPESPAPSLWQQMASQIDQLAKTITPNQTETYGR